MNNNEIKSDIIQTTEIFFDRHSFSILRNDDSRIRYNFTEYEKAIEMIVKHKKHIKIYLSKVELYKYTALFNTDNILFIMYCNFTNFSSSLEHVATININDIANLNIFLNNLESLNISSGNLISLHISCNLSTFPEQITKITSLKRLSIWYGSLSQLPDSFANLAKLEELDLRYNNFTEIPEVLGCLNIQRLNFSCNPIKMLPDFVCNMNTLHVHDTKISILPKNIQSSIVCDSTPLQRKCIKYWNLCDNSEVVKFSNMLHTINYTITYLAIVHNVPLDVVSLVVSRWLASS